jgi:radical SAM protein with 4Fe4S-binding SPASM domain
MTNTGATFLTEESFDIQKLILVLKNIKIEDFQDKKILEFIVKSLSKNDLSLLTPQQIFFLKNNEESKWANYLIFRYKFINFPKDRVVSEFPNHLIIEPVSACNLRCVMCFQIDETFSNNQEYMGMMDLDLFKKIIDDAYEIGIQAITLTGRGEPTLHPKIGEMLKYCSGKFFELKMNTNATKLTEKLIHEILASDITDLVFSVDSYQKQKYESIRVGGIFENIFKNIKTFYEIKKSEYPKSKCATRISGVKVEKNMDENKFKEFWKPYVEHVVLVEFDQKWDTYNNSKEDAGKGPCNYLWGEMNVWYDGFCNPCDVDYKSKLKMGSLLKNKISEVWKNKEYEELRNLHLTNSRQKCSPCDQCPLW